MGNDKESVDKFIENMNNWFMNRERKLNRTIKALGYKFKGFVSFDQILEFNIEDQNLLTEFKAFYDYKDGYFDTVDEMLRQLDNGEVVTGNLKGMEISIISKASGND